MRIDVVIDALRPLVTKRFPRGADKEYARRLVEEYDRLPRAPVSAKLSDAKATTLSVGRKGDAIVLSTSGNDDVEPSFVVLDTAGARSMARVLTELADSIDARARQGH